MMGGVVPRVVRQMQAEGLAFADKPILIGGMAMEYYGLRQAGKDIDLVVTQRDYQALARAVPEKRKDLYGDLGVVIGKFEIWRSIALLDYDFYKKDAIEEEGLLAVAIDRLLWSRVCAMEVEKYRKDLLCLRQYYYRRFTNPAFRREARAHQLSYQKLGGAVLGGRYED